MGEMAMRRLLTLLSLGVLCLSSGLARPAAAQNSTVSVRLVDALSTGSSQRGDTFNATLASPLIWRNRVVAEKGQHVTGHVTQVVNSGWFKRPAVITLSLGTAQGRSGSIPVQTGDLTIKADSHAKRNLLIIGGTAAAGAAIGGVSAGGKGAAIGAAAGAGAGTLGAYLAGNQEIVLPSETVLTFHVSSVVISPSELARLQSAAPDMRRDEPRNQPGNEAGYQLVESYPVVVERRHRHHHRDDDDEEDNDHHGHGEHHGEHDGEYHGEHQYRERYPEHVNVFFISDHRAKVAVFWPERTEYIYLRGNDLDDILNPLSDRIHVSVAFLRPRIFVKDHDDD
jgi:hypothetical protein